MVKDEEVEEALTSVREQHATYTSVEGRPLADGDFAQASMDGKPKEDDDGAAQPVHMDEVLIEIGGKNTVQEFTENLRGANAGDETRVRSEHIPTTLPTSGWLARRSSTR